DYDKSRDERPRTVRGQSDRGDSDHAHTGGDRERGRGRDRSADLSASHHARAGPGGVGRRSEGRSTVNSRQVLEIFARYRGDSPVMVSSGASGNILAEIDPHDPFMFNTGMAYT